MTNDTMIGVDLAKSVFQLHAASATGQLLFRKKLSRWAFAKFMAEHPPATIVMEACGSAHYWARELAQYGHEVKLIAAQYVRPFVKRQKDDAADAEAIVIAAQRPEMRFVEPKSAEQPELTYCGATAHAAHLAKVEADVADGTLNENGAIVMREIVGVLTGYPQVVEKGTHPMTVSLAGELESAGRLIKPKFALAAITKLLGT